MKTYSHDANSLWLNSKSHSFVGSFFFCFCLFYFICWLTISRYISPACQIHFNVQCVRFFVFFFFCICSFFSFISLTQFSNWNKFKSSFAAFVTVLWRIQIRNEKSPLSRTAKCKNILFWNFYGFGIEFCDQFSTVRCSTIYFFFSRSFFERFFFFFGISKTRKFLYFCIVEYQFK